MIRDTFRAELENQQKVLVFMWIGFVVAVFFYLWIPQLLLEQSQLAEGRVGVGMIRQLLWVLGLIEIGFLVWWKQQFLTKKAILRRAEKAVFFPRLVRGHETLEEERAGRIVSNYLVAKVVGFTIAGSIGIYGFVLALSGAYFEDQYILSFGSVMLLLYLYPSKAFLIGLLNSRH